ncbi:MAG: hypothetical protein LBD38_04300 [Streptococcaceae bacterium]|jgi:Rgg/GadR/MutR family transcriptional activator|nr:hypothetical protein [Streptococcaceae bacterium]
MKERMYGEVFRKLRKSKGYTLKEVTDGIATHSYLSKFERGECDISIRNFFSFLERLNTSWVEYASFFEEQEFEGMELITRIDHHLSHNEFREIEYLVERERSLSENGQNRAHRLNKILILGVLSAVDSKYTLDEGDFEFLHHTLLSDESWGLYELRLFSLTLHLFPIEMNLMFAKEIFNKMKDYLKIREQKKETRRVIISTLHNLVDFCVREKEYTLAYMLLRQIEERLMTKNLYFNRLHQMFYLGLVEIKLGEDEIGAAKIRKAIQGFEVLDENKAKMYAKRIEKEGINLR